MRYKREDFPSKTKQIVIEFPELCESAPKADIAALKATVETRAIASKSF